MAQGQFIVSSTNPNNEVGGGGCLCDEQQQTDCKPPYIVVYQNYMDSGISPHVVACQRCVDEWSQALKGEALSVGDARDADTVNPAAADPYGTEALVKRRQEAEAQVRRGLPTPPMVTTVEGVGPVEGEVDEDEKPEI